jgi:hypothetical protein
MSFHLQQNPVKIRSTDFATLEPVFFWLALCISLSNLVKG